MTRSGMVEGKSMLGGPRKTVIKARALRRTMTAPEVVLWVRLRARPGGYKFRRQNPAGPYILDFFCSDARMAVEIDGIAHDMGGQPNADRQRDRWLQEQGLAVLRISAGDVTRAPDAVVEQIVARCIERGIPHHHQAALGGPPVTGRLVPRTKLGLPGAIQPGTRPGEETKPRHSPEPQ